MGKIAIASYIGGGEFNPFGEAEKASFPDGEGCA